MPSGAILPGFDSTGSTPPEGQQTCEDAAGKRYLCGSRSAQALADLIGRNGRVNCEEIDRDRYRRIVAICSANGLEVNSEMVRQGWAVEYTQYSDGRYSDEESEARREKRGIFAGLFVEPSEWRRGKRLPSERAAGAGSQSSSQSLSESNGKCAIKGNISDSGKIYHVPGSRHYDRTVIDEARGERWFCSEQEA